jgi:hypothetical protein
MVSVWPGSHDRHPRRATVIRTLPRLFRGPAVCRRFVQEATHVAEVLIEYPDAVTSDTGKAFTARACGSEMPDGKWQGWIEFVPIGGGEPIRSARETTQPNRQDTLYWATGLTPVYLEGSLHRAARPPVRPLARRPDGPHFDGPAEPFVVHGQTTEAVLDPFSVYQKGEPLLRRQLSALAGWHLVNIITKYGLSDEGPAVLAAHEPGTLVEIIIDAVRQQPTR